MNEILKFKEGRKVGKYQNPAGPLEPTSSNPWQEYYTNVYTPNVGIVSPISQRTERANRIYRERQRREAQGAYNAQVRAGLRNPAEDMIPIWLRKPAEQAAPAVKQQTGGGTGGRTGGRVRGRVTPRVDLYAANFAGMNFTDAEKDFMTKAGFDPTNAKSVQEFILSRAAGANLGARKGAGIADGYWGDKSAAAFQALRNQGIFAPKVDAQETPAPVVEQPVDSPDFGYATNQDYSNGSQFKGLGFNNYQGLLLYAQNSQDLFAKDLRQRFGNRLTDLNYVESQLGISGKYRGGSAGDFGDMARSMQAWKTGVNNEFDKKRADYAQARLAERTDPTNGMVYSSPEMMRKFLNIKVSPEVRFGINKLDFSNMKYNLNFGNTGASTLGNIGTLGGGGLS